MNSISENEISGLSGKIQSMKVKVLDENKTKIGTFAVPSGRTTKIGTKINSKI